jgi:hypothetical protein
MGLFYHIVWSSSVLKAPTRGRRSCKARIETIADYNLGLVNHIFFIIIKMILDFSGVVPRTVKAKLQYQLLNNHLEVTP